jgi:environmental stress-induced protein Ves
MIIRATTLTAKPWPNGQGQTRDVWSGDGLLISIADLTQSATFSHFPNTNRNFTLIEGDPLALHLEGQPPLPCHLYVPTLFPGDIPTTAVMTPGPRRAFNVFIPNSTQSARVLVQSIAEGHTTPTHCTALHCLSGQIELNTETLNPGDTALNPTTPLHATNGPAMVILVFTDTSPEP